MRTLPLTFFTAISLIGLSPHDRAGAAGRGLPGPSRPNNQDVVQAILSKIGPPSQSTLNTLIDSRMQAPTDHRLTATEIAELRAAITRLPPLYQRVLAQHLRHLSVVGRIPGDGTGLTAPADKSKRPYNITFRASLLNETLSHFLTTKEQRCFSLDGLRVSVVINAGSMDALTYVFLHETTHVVDFSLGVGDRKNNPFSRGVWISHHDLASPYDKEVISQNVFRTNGHPFSIGIAKQVYSSLSTTRLPAYTRTRRSTMA